MTRTAHPAGAGAGQLAARRGRAWTRHTHTYTHTLSMGAGGGVLPCGCGVSGRRHCPDQRGRRPAQTHWDPRDLTPSLPCMGASLKDACLVCPAEQSPTPPPPPPPLPPGSMDTGDSFLVWFFNLWLSETALTVWLFQGVEAHLNSPAPSWEHEYLERSAVRVHQDPERL